MSRPPISTPEPKFRPRNRSVAEQLRYVTAAVDRSPHLLAIAKALTAKSGRPRNLPFRGFLIACCLHVCIQERNFYRGKIADMIAELTRDQRASLGLRGPISYSQIVRASLKLERAARDGLTIDDPDNPGHSLTLHLDEVMSYICSAAIPTGMITTSTVAADGTDFESPARRDERVNKDTGEILPCADPDATLGHRTSTQCHSDSWYAGQEVTVVTNAPDRATRTRPSPAAPTVVLAAGIRPAGRDRGRVTSGLILWCHRRQPVSEGLVDRGISQSADENFAQPLRENGIGLVIDLRSEQRKIRTALSDDRVLMINGGVFTTGTPEGLYKDLPVTKLQDTNADKARIHELYDRLLPFLCAPLTSLGADGRQRFRGPAHKRVRHVRCPNSSRSMRWSRLPKTTCKKGQPCICSTTFTLGPEDEVKIRQRDLWMSTDWYASYARRNASETGISLSRHHFGSLNRLFTQVRHQAGQGIAAAFSLFGTNLRSIQAWYDSRGLDNPWMVHLAPATGEVSDHPRLRRANRKKPKQSLMRRRASGTDPPPATAQESE